jgi:predicted esterase
MRDGTLHQGQPVLTAGKALSEAQAALILVHGRGATARDILSLAEPLAHPAYTYLAPQAANNTWYPYRFLEPLARNEPWLSSALDTLAGLVQQVETAGIPTARIVIGGFSQGACLASEFVARHAQRYGGLLLFSGGLIGPPGTPRTYLGTLDGTPVFLGCSDLDPHIPLERVQETADVLAQLGAQVTVRIYPNMDHTIVEDELEHARQVIDQVGREDAHI